MPHQKSVKLGERDIKNLSSARSAPARYKAATLSCQLALKESLITEGDLIKAAEESEGINVRNETASKVIASFCLQSSCSFSKHRTMRLRRSHIAGRAARMVVNRFQQLHLLCYGHFV